MKHNLCQNRLIGRGSDSIWQFDLSVQSGNLTLAYMYICRWARSSHWSQRARSSVTFNSPQQERIPNQFVGRCETGANDSNGIACQLDSVHSSYAARHETEKFYITFSFAEERIVIAGRKTLVDWSNFIFYGGSRIINSLDSATERRLYEELFFQFLFINLLFLLKRLIGVGYRTH